VTMREALRPKQPPSLSLFLPSFPRFGLPCIRNFAAQKEKNSSSSKPAEKMFIKKFQSAGFNDHFFCKLIVDQRI
jgi:hypothetical protein